MKDLAPFLADCLNTYYTIGVESINLLPIGADTEASLYKVQTKDHKTYFAKLKQSSFQDISIAIQELLQANGIKQLILPIKTKKGSSTQREDDYTVLVYPFIEGQDGFTRSLTDEQWIVLGQTLRQIHKTTIPPSLKAHVPQENFSLRWHKAVCSFYTHTKAIYIEDEIAVSVYKFLQEKKATILKIVSRFENLREQALLQPFSQVLCHSDIHAGNILISNKKKFYIVDWDDPILAPKERDLMFIGAGVGNTWNTPHIEALFYEGYGLADINKTLLAYYRHQRIVKDIAIYIQELLFNPIDNKNRSQMYRELLSQFDPGNVVEIAFQTDLRRA